MLNGNATLVEASTVKAALGVPLLPVKMRFVPERIVAAYLGNGTLMTSIEPFTSNLLVQPSPLLNVGRLSAVNLGLLLYAAIQGWRKDWTDWFWPAVLAAYLGELIFEYYRGGQGGGAIRFDDPTIRVATGAHLASAAYALLALIVARWHNEAGPPNPEYTIS